MSHHSSESQCPGGLHHGSSSRRDVLKFASNGFGLMALSALMSDKAYADLAAPKLHFEPKVKIGGSVSCRVGLHMSTHSTRSRSLGTGGQAVRIASPRSRRDTAGRVWMGSPWKFDRRGKSGLWVSDLFPHAARMRGRAVRGPLHGSVSSHCMGKQNLLLHTGRSDRGHCKLGGVGVVRPWLGGRQLAGVRDLDNNDWVPQRRAGELW